MSISFVNGDLRGNNRNLILFLKFMDIRENCRIRGDVDGGRIFPEMGNAERNGKYFGWWWWGKGWYHEVFKICAIKD
jgi:hypothetical protein